MDENFLNYMLFTMFYDDKPFSLKKKLTDMMPTYFENASMMLKAMMHTQVFAAFMPEIVKEFGNTQADLRCSMNQKLLFEGSFEEQADLLQDLSSITFRDGDKIDGDLHFGCSVVAY